MQALDLEIQSWLPRNRNDSLSTTQVFQSAVGSERVEVANRLGLTVIPQTRIGRTQSRKI